MRMKLPFFRHGQPVGDGLVQLVPLTPSYEPSHEVYWRAIESALTGENQRKIRNIALTGSYGVGKSSIIQKVVETCEVVQISLSTLGLSDESALADPDSKAAASKTNRIQKEIVKQLLYREEPVKLPGSRYRRLERFQFWQALWVAALVAVVVTLVFLLTGWTERIDALAKSYIDLGNAVHLLVLGAATALALVVQALFHNRIRVEQLSAGAATISLSPASTTFFDEYLDEIVYFFDVTRHDLVIFEDIDRFDDPHIFETLRALNTLLNGAKQLKGRNIRFIYAIKDSIFDALGTRAALEGDVGGSKQSDAAVDELARANRTKFFDLVIPVVPFITHRSARDLMVRVMGDTEHKVSHELIDLAARHSTDMRLIKNVRNEFVIFREKIILDKESVPGLTEDQLFAMMLYKSTHLSDFEVIKDGRSNLDLLYSAGRRLVADNIASLGHDSRTIRQRIGRLDSVEPRSEKLGDALLQYIERITRHLRVNEHSVRAISLSGRTRSDDDLRAADFWQEFIGGDSAVQVTLTDRHRGQTHRFSISRADASDALVDSLFLEDWQENDRAELEERQKEISEQLDFLSRADMDSLMNRDEFKLKSSESEVASFRQLADEHLESELARQLVEAGYITRDFTLYTSSYYAERVSSRATNFIIRNVDRNVADAHLALTPDDVEAVLRERGEIVLRQRGLYNIAVLDHLLEANDSRVDILANKLMDFSDDEQLFVQAYLSGGNQQTALIQKLADRWRLILRFIVSEAEVDETMRLQLLNAALESVANEVSYVVDESVRTYFEEHYFELKVFVSTETSADAAEQITGLLEAMGARIASLAPISAEVRRAIVAKSRYRITRDNLIAAIGGTQDLALDSIRELDPTVYAYVLNHLSRYLAALRETQPASLTIKNCNAFGAIVEDVLEHDERILPAVVASASPECQVPNVIDVSSAAWPVLAQHLRFPATFDNVKAYIYVADQVDAPIAHLLSETGSIEVPAGSEESEKEAVARRLVAARETLPDPELRSSLLADLDLEEALPVDSIQPEPGNLIGLLLDKEIIADDAESFSLALEADWNTREFAISKSKQFSSYMTPIQVPPDDIVPLMKSRLVPDSVKKEILDRIDEFVPTNERRNLTAIAGYADSKQEKLSIEHVTRLATSGVDTQLVLRLLESLLYELEEPQLAATLKTIGGDYATLSERNGKRPNLSKTGYNLALVKRLTELDVVSSYEVRDGGISVNMRRG